jgi:hypothetical protein
MSRQKKALQDGHRNADTNPSIIQYSIQWAKTSDHLDAHAVMSSTKTKVTLPI